MKKNQVIHLAGITLALLVMTCARSSAQIITTTIQSQGSGSGTLDLEANGTTDWVHFGVSGTSTAFNLSNEKSGGSVGGLDSVGPVSESNDVTPGQTQDTSNIAVSYTNGMSPGLSSSLVSGTPAGTWNVQTGYTGTSTPVVNATLSFVITFPLGVSNGDIYVATNNYKEAAVLTAVLSNGNTTTTPVAVGDSGENRYEIFDINAKHLTPGSSLTVSWTMPSGAFQDNISLSGVALDLSVPEPSTWALMIGGLAFLAFCVRRQGALVK